MKACTYIYDFSQNLKIDGCQKIRPVFKLLGICNFDVNPKFEEAIQSPFFLLWQKLICIWVFKLEEAIQSPFCYVSENLNDLDPMEWPFVYDFYNHWIEMAWYGQSSISWINCLQINLTFLCIPIFFDNQCMMCWNMYINSHIDCAIASNLLELASLELSHSSPVQGVC